ncbi:MAG TPA: hypothetical protein P5248_11615 [Bacteroidales bacterium]|nr:hypothetical protein [Bacteroidales bacterium]
MKILLNISLLLLLMASISCTKDEAEPEPPPPTNYQPISKGSYWTYSGYNGGLSYNLEMNGKTDTLGGIVWFGMDHTLLGEGWFRKEAGIYYNKYFVNGSFLEFPYLKDNETAGHTWETQLSLAGINTKLIYTIKERDVSKVVSGQLYKNVIVVKMDTDWDLGGGFGTIDYTGEYWYANDIGFIFSDVENEGMTFLEIFEIR